MTEVNPLLAPDLSPLAQEDNARAAHEEEARLIADLEAGVAEAEAEWPGAMARAKAMPDEEGILRSVWVGPLEQLTAKLHDLTIMAGDDAGAVAEGKGDAHERALPDEYARKAYCVGKGLRARLKTTLARRRRSHAKQAEKLGLN